MIYYDMFQDERLQNAYESLIATDDVNRQMTPQDWQARVVAEQRKYNLSIGEIRQICEKALDYKCGQVIDTVNSSTETLPTLVREPLRAFYRLRTNLIRKR